ncbi:MAG: organomercurial lyase [Acidimicrobiia bacterium]
MVNLSTTSELAKTIWDRFQAVGFTPDFGRKESRLLIELYRRLAAEGRPIPAEEVERLAEGAGITSEVAGAFVEMAGERDEEGALRGIVGLSLNRHPHKFLVQGNELTTWCALDPMLIAPIMTEAVELESDDPRNGEPIRVSVSPSGVQTYEPTTAVVSIVIPESGATDNLETIWKMFCHQVHFFTSRESGEQFFSGRDIEVYFLTMEEAFDLGRLTFGPIHAQQ